MYLLLHVYNNATAAVQTWATLKVMHFWLHFHQIIGCTETTAAHSTDEWKTKRAWKPFIYICHLQLMKIMDGMKRMKDKWEYQRSSEHSDYEQVSGFVSANRFLTHLSEFQQKT